MQENDEWRGQDLEEENRKLREENKKLRGETDGISAETVHRATRLINIGNAVLLVFSGLWTILTSTFRPVVFIFGLYVMIFSCCLGCFEFRCPLQICTRFFMRNLGFLFTWKGRLAFYLFIASLIIGQGIVGLIVGCITLANCALNVFVMLKYPDYFEFLKKESEEMAKGAIEAELRQAATGFVFEG